MRKLRHPTKAVLFLMVAWAGRSVSAQEGYEGWHLEPGVGQAHLVMVARVASISRLTVVEGAKTDVVLREYRFQPVRRLKGIFQRDQLSMTPSDLGIRAENAASAPALKEGEFRLLILVQQRGNFTGCVSAPPGVTSFDQRVPPLSGPDDPLIAVVETLIKVADARSRRERAKLLIDRIIDVDGLSAVPLLSSLRLRADWAASDGRALAPLARLSRNPLTAVHGAAVDVLREMLANGMKVEDAKQLDAVAEALRAIIGSDVAITHVRLAALEALGNLLALNANTAGARELLIAQLNGAATRVERDAAATALSRIALPQTIAAVQDALAGLPLDELPARESVYARAAVRLDAAGTERVLLARLKQSLAARQSLEAEIEPLSQMQSKESLPLILAAADQVSLSPPNRYHIALALGRLGDDRAVPVLTSWLRGDDYQLKEFALAALENLDSELAAREVRPSLKSEAQLSYKLRIARLLARHGMSDGYALATEHLADLEYTPAATLVLAALNDPRTSTDLSEILAAQPDRLWHAAALTGLAAIGDATARKQLLDILTDDRNPLAAGAAQAAGLSDDSQLLLPLSKLVHSRNKQIARASLTALLRFLSGVRSSPRGLASVTEGNTNILSTNLVDRELPRPATEVPAETRSVIAEAVASLVVDTYVEADLRQQALAVARLLRGERYDALLSQLADQSELEGTPVLAEVQAERRRLNGVDQHR